MKSYFNNFLWGLIDQGKKENMINTLQNGGMNMVDMCTQVMSLRIKWLLSFQSFKELKKRKGFKFRPVEFLCFEYWILKKNGEGFISL